MKKYMILMASALLLAGTAAAQSTALPFLRIERDPATSALAGAGRASSFTVAYAAFRNPAAVPFATTRGEAAVSYQGWAPKGVKSTNINFGGAFKVSEGVGLTLGAAWQGGEPYESALAGGIPGDSFTPSDVLVSAGGGFRLTEGLSLGIGGRYAIQTLAQDVKLSGFAADAFLLYRNGGLSATAGIASVGPGVKSGSTTYPLPTSVAAGVAYEAVFAETSGILAVADFDYFLSGGIGLALGVQYAYDDMVFVRAGYHLGTEKAPLPSYASVGIGGKFSGVHIDLSFLTASPTLGGTVALGIGYAF